MIDTAAAAGDIDPVEAASLLAALVDTLLPGDVGWPSGALVGVHAVLTMRLVQERGETAVADLVARLSSDAPALLGQDEAARVAAVAAWEARDCDLFGWVRDAAFMAYYENPIVAMAINAQGHPYKLIPHVSGYRLPRFDPVSDTPKHGRGGWIPTEAVQRVQVDTLNLGKWHATGSGRKK